MTRKVFPFDEDLEIKERELEEDDDYNEIPPDDIVAFNELRSCADIVRMYHNNQLIIQPDFQRDVVWSNASKSRFIDSLIKQIPIPSMCISLDYKTDERLVIDGLQRISAIISFLTDENWKLASLEDIDSKISGKTSGYIKTKYNKIYDRVENLTIPITVIRCDFSKKSHMKYLFTIFHRLNTGGNKLTNQEIRNCIFSGEFNKLIKDLAQYDNFRRLFNLEKGKLYRFSYEELILRVFAFDAGLDEYKGKLANFLNDFMESNKKITESEIVLKESKFKRVIDLIYLKILNKKPFPKINKTTVEGIFLGVLRNINNLEQMDGARLKDMYSELRSDKLYSVDSLKSGLANRESVQNRLNRAIEIFKTDK